VRMPAVAPVPATSQRPQQIQMVLAGGTRLIWVLQQDGE